MTEENPIPQSTVTQPRKKRSRLNFKFSNINENLPIFLLIPSLLGGFWQLFELSSISLSYIRFFSYSQLLADGLMILFIIMLVFIPLWFIGSPLRIRIFLRKYLKFHEANSHWSTVMSLFSVLIFITFAPIRYAFGWIKLRDLGLFLGGIVLLCVCFRLIRYLNTLINKKAGSEQRLKNYSKVVFFTSTLTVTILGGLILETISTLHKSFTFPPNNINITILKKKIQNEFKSEKVSIRYFNDQYIFWEVGEKKTRVLVTKYEELTELSDDKNESQTP